MFLQRFTIPDVSMTVYIGSEVANKQNHSLCSCVMSRYYAPMFLKYSAKLYHNYKSDPKCSCQIYIISYLGFFWFIRGYGDGAPWPNVNLISSLLVVEGGHNCYAISLHQLSIPSIPRQNRNVSKIIINRDIGILSFTFV